MQELSYGHRFYFNSSGVVPDAKSILVNEIVDDTEDTFTFKVDFESNQNREIYLKAKYDFREDEHLDEFMFVIEDVVSFFCDVRTKQIFYKKSLHFSDALLHYWLLHIVAPIYFTLSGKYYLLHAGAVVVENKAIVFMGESHAGKSTLTDYFLKKEYKLISDDKVPTFFKDNTFFCELSHPYHRPFRDLETLGLKAKNVLESTQKIECMFWIEPVGKEDAVSIEELKGIEKFRALRYATEMDIYVNQSGRFEYITNLANHIKLFRLNIPRDLERLEEVYQTICSHVKNTKAIK